MISVSEALERIQAHSSNLGNETVDLHQANGRILAQDLYADRDFPPFDRVTMDGIAISTAAFREGRRAFPMRGLQAAGQEQQALQDAESCIEVMTGAVLPDGCDAVIPYEDCLIEDGIATLQVAGVTVGQNIHPKGSDGRAGQLLVKASERITPAIIGIAATIGAAAVAVRRLPRVAVCSTGDELVPVTEQPAAHQIRRSNSAMLAAALSSLGITPSMYHLPDEPEAMRGMLAAMRNDHDVLLFSGAVSKGKFDYLPQVLTGLGMSTVFHRVAQKPGKPLLFGTMEEGSVVFGFPGNPVSTLICFQVFFGAWLRASLGYHAPHLTAQLTQDFSFRPELAYHLPVSVALQDGCLLATPHAGANSGDMVSLAQADATITLPASRTDFKRGEVFPLTWLREL